ncbi:uncharacterized protein LOC129614527 [Condylostylus longicornis]|uniref:uncharacterized protein LOC129614527 n=1 Tax=Condylostylus longicornis TaxID=2530218 RepID=UPI00244E1938|nr:uncharacterized protein LOC129614527 [Condylostylus longicornis]
MCCWSMRVLWTVLQNMFIRLGTDLMSFYYNRCCCCTQKSVQKETELNADKSNDTNFSDYVIIKDLDVMDLPAFNLRPSIPPALPPLPKLKPIESEPYYRIVDRFSAEEILRSRIDGSCLVRPYRQMDDIIKYIVTIYVKGNYFHLYIRYIAEKQKYGIGLKKPFEKLFNTPNEIINYYRINKLFCTNRTVNACVLLIPIS